MRKYLKNFRQFYWSRRVKQKCKSYGNPMTVNHKSKVSKNTILGSNVHFNGMHIKGNGLVTIGDNFHSGQDCMIITHVHNFDRGTKIPYDNTYIHKDVTIEDNVWLGDRVIILGGVLIGEGAIIQAGSVVVSNIPKHAIAGGHPASVFKMRDIEHYNTLKKKKLFY